MTIKGSFYPYGFYEYVIEWNVWSNTATIDLMYISTGKLTYHLLYTYW